MYKLHSILEAACLTAVIVVALFFYTLQSRRDFVKGYALSFSLLSVLLMASVLQVNIYSHFSQIKLICDIYSLMEKNKKKQNNKNKS